jgi:hypothetical protein
MRNLIKNELESVSGGNTEEFELSDDVVICLELVFYPLDILQCHDENYVSELN